ncbi:HD domain-containing protein [Paenibacillus peoriae]|uniref:HD domain-containing protein n=1 Tax=Paenibacillus peoriae TaxID=59893 RepID=UPI00026C60CF|nr:HD domain-containing protein [Paenibacillus peoriae]MEC0180511.1 HD domain-containing protein [Paenibacillus peoriae]
MNIENAIAIAAKAHQGQADKGGQPYIFHPLQVMNRVEHMDEKIVAVLHDVLEDTEVTADQLKEAGFGRHIIEAVEGLTRNEGEEYSEFIRRAQKNPLSRVVKIADIMENMNLERIPNPTEKDLARIEKYKQALLVLLN